MNANTVHRIELEKKKKWGRLLPHCEAKLYAIAVANALIDGLPKYRAEKMFNIYPECVQTMVTQLVQINAPHITIPKTI